MSWRGRPPGLVSGPRKLKIVRTASSLRTGTTKRVAWWWRGEHEAESDLVDAAPDGGRARGRCGNAERLEHVGSARQRLVAERLPCLATAHPAAAAMSAAVVETLDVERPPPVPAVSTRSSRLGSAAGVANERIVRGEPRELLDRLSLRAQRDEQALLPLASRTRRRP